MSKNNKDFSIFTILAKIFLACFFPAYFALILTFAIIGFMFDLLFTLLDARKLDRDKATERKHDRFANRIEWLLNAIFDYFKMIFSK